MSNKNSTHCYRLGVDQATAAEYTGSFTKIIGSGSILTNIQFGEYLGIHTPKSGSENFKLTSEITSSMSLGVSEVLLGTPHILSFTVEPNSNPVLAYTDGNFAPISSSGASIGDKT
jgi:hypothetical protein